MNLEFDGHFLAIPFSAGWTNYMSGDSTEEMLKRADDALYVNKRASAESVDFSTLAS
jgi:PleD family two-component response regulator